MDSAHVQLNPPTFYFYFFYSAWKHTANGNVYDGVFANNKFDFSVKLVAEHLTHRPMPNKFSGEVAGSFRLWGDRARNFKEEWKT